MLHNSVFWPDFGRTATGKALKWALRPAFGRLEGRFLFFPVAVRPKSGPEGRFTARKLYSVTLSTYIIAQKRKPIEIPAHYRGS